MPRTPAVPWLIVMTVFVILAAVIFLSGQIVGSMFPFFESEVQQGDIGHGLFPLIKEIVIFWLPTGLAAGFVVWALAYTFIFEAFRGGV